MPEKANNETVTVNRQAYHDYFVDETFEAGIALTAWPSGQTASW